MDEGASSDGRTLTSEQAVEASGNGKLGSFHSVAMRRK